MVCNPIAILGKYPSINLATIPITTQITSNIMGEACLKKDKNFICFYLKKLSTNSYLLNT